MSISHKKLKPFQISLFILLVIFLFEGCMNKYKRREFSQHLRDKYDLQKNEIKNLQFYLSERIVLQRDRSSETYKIRKGKFERMLGDSIEQVIIEKGTPGTIVPDNPSSNNGLIKITQDALKISFDKKTFKFLVFKRKTKGSTNVSLYYLCYIYELDELANENLPEYKYVQYGDRLYEHKNAVDGVPHLLVDEKTLFKVIKNRSVLPGRKLKDNEKQQISESQKNDDSKK